MRHFILTSHFHLERRLNGQTCLQNLLSKFKWMSDIQRNFRTMKTMEKKPNYSNLVLGGMQERKQTFRWLCFGTLKTRGRKFLLLASQPTEWYCTRSLESWAWGLVERNCPKKLLNSKTGSFCLWLLSAFLLTYIWAPQTQILQAQPVWKGTPCPTSWFSSSSCNW